MFPAGLPIPQQTYNYVAGSVTDRVLVMPDGTRIPPGTSWHRDLPVQSFLALDSKLFQSGFKSYSVSGRDGVVVVDGARVDVAMPLLQVDRAAARDLASGGDPDEALSLWLPPLQQDQPGKGTVSLRQGASLAI